eukprot:CAMPEP_0194114028 /NCGR_PEP_ID=MMETSP0150-20130528/18619_1 /TAXON_ID=122233 /ORGANISM="Chaetoceros debilis, Strain MM31A-1" /LENGTH=48 /DNA_ID= /DNA_START= /DNA_END= /DNA_ORIENTATION=
MTMTMFMAGVVTGDGACVFLEEHVPPAEQHPPFSAGGFSIAGTGAGAG